MDVCKIYVLIFLFTWVEHCCCRTFRRRHKYPNVRRITKGPIMCYDCEYSENYGRSQGNRDCLDASSITNDTTEMVSCMGHCETSYLRLDSKNLMFRRRCSMHCHDNSHEASRDLLRECCEFDFCNTAANTVSFPLPVLLMASLSVLFLVISCTGQVALSRR